MDRTDFMDIVYDLLKDDPDNNRANEIINAADEYAEDAAKEALKGKDIDKDIDVPSKWIPVSERLPEEGQGCLVCDKGQILIDTFIGHGNPYNWRWYVRDYEAWMPLPEPWEGEENGNIN